MTPSPSLALPRAALTAPLLAALLALPGGHPTGPAPAQAQASQPVLEVGLYEGGLLFRTLPASQVKAELLSGGRSVDGAAGSADERGEARLSWGSYALTDGGGIAIARGDAPTVARPGDQLRILRRGGAALVVDVPLLRAEVDAEADAVRGLAPAGAEVGLALSVDGGAAQGFTTQAGADGRFAVDLAGRLDLPAAGVRGTLTLDDARGYRFRLAVASGEATAVVAAEQLRGAAPPGSRVVARLARGGQDVGEYGPLEVLGDGTWALPLGASEGPPIGPAPAMERLQAGDRLELDLGRPGLEAGGAFVTRTLVADLPALGLSLEPGEARARGTAPASAALRLEVVDGDGAVTRLAATAGADGQVDVDLGGLTPAPGWRARLLWPAAPGLTVGAVAVLPELRLQLGGGFVEGLAAPGTAVTAELADAAGKVKGLGAATADDQGAWRVRLRAPGGGRPGPILIGGGAVRAEAGDRVSVTTAAGDPLVLTVPALEAAPDAGADAISGRAPAGAGLRLWVHGAGSTEPLSGVAGEDGSFRFDLAGRHDLGPGSAGRLEARTRSGQVFSLPWALLSMTVDLSSGAVSGVAVPGAAVQVALVDAQGVTVAQAQTRARSLADFDLPAGLLAGLGLQDGTYSAAFVDVTGAAVPLRAGDRVRLDAAAERAEIALPELDGSALVEEDRVVGRASAGSEVLVQVRAFGAPPRSLPATADGQGRFQLDLAGQADLAYNDLVGLFQAVGGHGVRRTLTVPGLTVDLARRQVLGVSAPEARLRARLLRGARTLAEASARGDARGAFLAQWPTDTRPQAGDIVAVDVLEPAGESLSLTLPELTVALDPAAQAIRGRARPGADLVVTAGDALQEGFTIAQDWPIVDADGAWRAQLVPSWPVAPGTTVQARDRLPEGHLVIRRAIVPLLRAEHGGPQACGVAAIHEPVSAELAAAGGTVLSRAAGVADAFGRFSLAFRDHAGSLLASASGQRARADFGPGRAEVELPALDLRVDWAAGTVAGTAPAGLPYRLQFPARRCLEGLQPGANFTAVMGGVVGQDGRIDAPIPGQAAPGQGIDVSFQAQGGHQAFRQVFRNLARVFIDTARVEGLGNAGARAEMTLFDAQGAAAATAAATVEPDGRFGLSLRESGGRERPIQAGDRLRLQSGGETVELTVPPLSFDWSRGEPVAGQAPAGSQPSLQLRLADGRLLTFPRRADASGRWGFAAAELPPRGGWELGDVVALRVTLRGADGHEIIAETPGFAGGGGDRQGGRVFLPWLGQPQARAASRTSVAAPALLEPGAREWLGDDGARWLWLGEGSVR